MMVFRVVGIKIGLHGSLAASPARNPVVFAAYIDTLLAYRDLLDVALPSMRVHHCVLTGGASMHDIVIRGGTIVDGTGKVAFTGDVAIAGSRIAAVGGCNLLVEQSGRRLRTLLQPQQGFRAIALPVQFAHLAQSTGLHLCQNDQCPKIKPRLRNPYGVEYLAAVLLKGAIQIGEELLNKVLACVSRVARLHSGGIG